MEVWHDSIRGKGYGQFQTADDIVENNDQVILPGVADYFNSL